MLLRRAFGLRGLIGPVPGRACSRRRRSFAFSRLGCVIVDLGSRQHRLPCSGQDLDYAPLKRSVRHIESTMPVGRKLTPRTCAGCAGRRAPSGSAGRARPARWRSARRSRITHRQRRLRAKPLRALRPQRRDDFAATNSPDLTHPRWHGPFRSQRVASAAVPMEALAGARCTRLANPSTPVRFWPEPPLQPPALLASGTRQPSSAVEPKLPHRSR